MTAATETEMFVLLPRFKTVARLYTREEAHAHFVATGDSNPDTYQCTFQWANANDGEAVWSREFAVSGELAKLTPGVQFFTSSEAAYRAQAKALAL